MHKLRNEEHKVILERILNIFHKTNCNLDLETTE